MIWPKPLNMKEKDALIIFWSGTYQQMSSERLDILRNVVPEIKGCVFDEINKTYKILTSYIYPLTNTFS